MLKAVIFDMDGVLIDSEPLHYEANKIMLKEKLSIELDYEYYKQYIGTTNPYMWGKMAKDFGITEYTPGELRDMADAIKEQLIESDGYMEIEGVTKFVNSLYGNYKLAVASSSYLCNIQRNVKKLGIDNCFDELASGVDVTRPKPFPDVFLKAAKMLSVKPEECIVVEDSTNGVKAAKAAGMACIGFINKNSGDQDLSEADYLFEAYEGIDIEFLKMVHARCFDEKYKVIETERIAISEFIPDDAKDENVRNAFSQVFNLDGNISKVKEYIREYRKNAYKFYGFGVWLLENKESGEFLGIAGIDRKENGNFELGYYIEEKYRRDSYGYEACKTIIEYVNEEFGLREVYATIEKSNIPSINLAKKLGFSKIVESDQFILKM